MKKIRWRLVIVGLIMGVAVIWIAIAAAEVTWSFNWYCSGCAKIGGRTTGQEGPFSSESSCESARSRMERNMRSIGGGATTGSCSSSGYSSPPSSSSGRSEPSYGGRSSPEPSYQQPQY